MCTFKLSLLMQWCNRLEEFAAKQIKTCEQDCVVEDEEEVEETDRKIPPYWRDFVDKRQNTPMGCLLILNILFSSLCLRLSSTFPHRLYTLLVGRHTSRTVLWWRKCYRNLDPSLIKIIYNNVFIKIFAIRTAEIGIHWVSNLPIPLL